jgi:hypothetical protein
MLSHSRARVLLQRAARRLQTPRGLPAAITYPRHFSAKEEDKKAESFEDTVKRMQNDGKKLKSPDDDTSPHLDGFLRKAADSWAAVSQELGTAWQELLKSGERKDINKKIGHPEATAEGETEYTGPVEIMVIDESENLSAWERMQLRLTEAPIIQGMSI